jgi:hypothetical protein
MSTSSPETTPDKPKDKKTRLLSEGIMLALASAGAYLFAFFYEQGYTAYFEMPSQLINVSLVNILIFGMMAITFVTFTFMMTNTVWMLLPKLHPYLAFHLPRILVAICFFVIYPILMFGFSGWRIWILPLVFFSLMAFMTLILPLWGHKKAGNISQRYDAMMEAERNSKPDLTDKFAARFGTVASFMVAILIGLMIFTYWSGRAEAVNQRNFLVVNSVPEMVVLRIYGDNMICAPFNRETKEVQKSFIIIKAAEDPKLTFNLEEVGPLTPVKPLAKPSPAQAPLATPSVGL